jgi:cyclophilin family peptidyl-prolyl cis-trans isomerase
MLRSSAASAVLAAALAAASATAAPAGPSAADWRPVNAQNTLVIDTSQGRVIVELYPEVAPAAVAQVETLVRQHFYDGLTFFRVIDGFMDQTGDPQNNGKGSSSLPNIKAEFDFRYAPGPGSDVMDLMPVPGGVIGFVGALPIVGQPDAMAALTVDGKVRGVGLFCSGVIGMARSQDPDSANSQFFLMRGEQPSLNEKYTPIGRVVSGLAAVRAIKTGDPVADPKDRMVSVQVLADIPAGIRPDLRVLDTGSAYFRAEAARQRAVKGDNFDPCDLEVPAQGG